MLVGAFLVLAYNLELFGGRFHTDFWFAAAWGAFPALTSYWANALAIDSAAEAVAAVAVTLALLRAQHRPAAALDAGPRAAARTPSRSAASRSSPTAR